MNVKVYRILIIIALFISAISCTASESTQRYTPSRTGIPNINNTAKETITIVPPIKTITSSPVLSATPVSETQVVTVTSTPPTNFPINLINSNNCPSNLSPAQPSILQNGSILFSYFGSYSPSGIWSFSTEKSAPQLLINGLEYNYPDSFLSPSKLQLAWLDFLANPPLLILYNLPTNKAEYIPVQPEWTVINNWLPDGKIKILTNTKEVEAESIAYDYDIYDPITKKIDKSSELFILPNLQINYPKFWDGFASINPSRTMVFYTALENNITDFILLDVQENNEKWRYSGEGYIDWIPVAAWTANGDKVIFATGNVKSTQRDIMVLDINSLSLNKIMISPDLIRELKWSPDSRHLLISKSLGYVNKGPGFIVDTETGQYKEICSTGYDFGRGYWIENTNLLLYTMYSETHTKVALLDVTTWETQDIIELGADIYINYSGWTPFIPSP